MWVVLEGSLAWVLFCSSSSQTHKGTPLAGVLLLFPEPRAWRASLSTVQLLVSACGERDATVMVPSPTHDWAYCFPSVAGFPPQSPHFPSGCLPKVNRNPRPRIALQSLHPSSQPLCLLGDLSGVCMAAARIVGVILIPFKLSQISFTLSIRCFSSHPKSCPDVGIKPLLQFPHPLRAGPVLLTLLTLLFFPLLPSSYWILHGSIYSFPVVRYSCPLLACVLQALLCLKVYSWCIRGERCTSTSTYSSPIFLSPCLVLTVASWPAYRFLRRQQKTGKGIWYSHLFSNFPQFVVSHTVKGLSRKIPGQKSRCFSEIPLLYDPVNVGNLISDSFSKPS